MQYLLRMEPFGLGKQWEMTIDMPSDEMAVDYARRTMATCQACRASALALLVWRMPNQKLLARFVLDKPVARNTEG